MADPVCSNIGRLGGDGGKKPGTKIENKLPNWQVSCACGMYKQQGVLLGHLSWLHIKV